MAELRTCGVPMTLTSLQRRPMPCDNTLPRNTTFISCRMWNSNMAADCSVHLANLSVSRCWLRQSKDNRWLSHRQTLYKQNWKRTHNETLRRVCIFAPRTLLRWPHQTLHCAYTFWYSSAVDTCYRMLTGVCYFLYVNFDYPAVICHL